MTELVFKIAEPGKEPREVPVLSGLTIGRRLDNQLVLDDPNVSGHHALVLAGDGDLLFIEDLGSTNKTRIEDGPDLVKGQRFPLTDNVKIQVGAVRIAVMAVAKGTTTVRPPPVTAPAMDSPAKDGETKDLTAAAQAAVAAADSAMAAKKPAPKPAAKESASKAKTAAPEGAPPEPAPYAIKNGAGVIPDDLPAFGQRSPESFWFNRFEIDLATLRTQPARHQCRDLDDVLGGIARGFKLLDGARVDDPYAPAAPLILNLGVLSGTQFMTGLRTFFVGYSPLNALLADKPSAMWTAGSGKFGTKLRFLDVDEVVFRGRAPKPVYLHIHQSDTGPVFEFKSAQELVGLRVNQKIQRLHELYPDAHFAVIGPAGENFESVRFAAIALSTENQLRSGDMKSRFCGRGGFGGVMGSKNLLAIVADTKDGPKTKPEGLNDLNKIVARGEGSRRFRDKRKANGAGGTWANVEALNPLHAMPEYNFVPTGTKVSAGLHRPAVEEEGPYIVKDEACFACGIACHKNVYEKNEDGKRGKFLAKLDYEPLNLMSANIGIFDVGQACHLVDLVDDLGMDSISCGVTLAYAMEHNKRHANDGSLLPDDLQYGDFAGAERAILAIGSGELPLLGQGSKRLSEALGATGYAMHCKGMEYPAYLPQTNPGYPWALAGGHMSMRTYLLLLMERDVSMDYWVDAITGRGPMIMRDDVIGICKFAGTTNEHMTDAITMMTGLAITEEELEQAVRRAYLRGYKLERDAGFTRDDYRMPEEVHGEFPQIELPRLNTKEFFDELRTRVCDRFDEMLAKSGV